MNGTVAQVAAIISHGNYFLETGKLSGFFPDNSAFQFCKRVDFRVVAKKRLFVGSSVSTVAEDPSKWFDYLRQTNCERLRYVYRHSDSVKRLDDYNLAGFVGGGGDWFVEAIYGESSVLWRSFWEVTAKEHDDQKIWNVIYGTDGAHTSGYFSQIDIQSSSIELSNSLNEAIDFASAFDLNGWIPTFEKALNALNSDSPEGDYYHKDLLAGPISIERRRLFYAAAHAWVFGGMGWWNDNAFQSPDTQNKFQRVTSNLYDPVYCAYGAVLNS